MSGKIYVGSLGSLCPWETWSSPLGQILNYFKSLNVTFKTLNVGFKDVKDLKSEFACMIVLEYSLNVSVDP